MDVQRKEMPEGMFAAPPMSNRARTPKGCGKGHIPPAIQHIEQFLCHFSALRIQHIREMPGQNRRPQRLNAQRVEIAASLKIGARRLIKRNQMARVVVHAP